MGEMEDAVLKLLWSIILLSSSYFVNFQLAVRTLKIVNKSSPRSLLNRFQHKILQDLKYHFDRLPRQYYCYICLHSAVFCVGKVPTDVSLRGLEPSFTSLCLIICSLFHFDSVDSPCLLWILLIDMIHQDLATHVQNGKAISMIYLCESLLYDWISVGLKFFIYPQIPCFLRLGISLIANKLLSELVL